MYNQQEEKGSGQKLSGNKTNQWKGCVKSGNFEKPAKEKNKEVKWTV